MAIVQISRIQHRRGRKNAGVGLPQLASAELGWAIDAQELYIGNGSVSEGAPYVGNTQILTEHTNLFDFVKTYTYKNNAQYIQTGETQGLPVLRSLQDRLDDIVNSKAFGARGDGSLQTKAIQRAIDQLFLNPATKGSPESRVELILDAGRYLVDDTIYLPPYVTIKGAGENKTIIESSGSHPVFKTVNESSTIGNYNTETTNDVNLQSRNISMKGMSIHSDNGIGLELLSCKDSMFENMNIKGNWNLGDSKDEISVSILMKSFSSAVTCQNNKFKNVSMSNATYGVMSNHDIKNNTFDDCDFDTMFESIVLGKNTVLGLANQQTGPIGNRFNRSKFDNVYGSAFVVYNGSNNISENNKYYDVGNHGGNSGTAVEPVIKFYTRSNQSLGDWFKRTEELGFDPNFLVNYPYIPEISGPSISSVGHTNQLRVSNYGDVAKLLKLPAGEVASYDIDYIYKSSAVEAYRSGIMTVFVDPINNKQMFSDHYDFVGNTDNEYNLNLFAQTYDEDNDGSIDTVSIMFSNSTENDEATFTFKIKSKT